MEIKKFQEQFNSIVKGLDFSTLKIAFSPYLNELLNAHFSLSNPLFWVFFLILVLILSRSWGIKKSFSFCAIIAVVLLATTMLENFMADTLAKSLIFDARVLKLIAMLIITLVSIYYFLIRRN